MYKVLTWLIVIALAVGVVLLERFLAHSKSRWPGLVLPVISFLLSLLYPLSMVNLGGSTAMLIGQVILVWIIANIPTYILIAVYIAVRRRSPNRRERDKMTAKDL